MQQQDPYSTGGQFGEQQQQQYPSQQGQQGQQPYSGQQGGSMQSGSMQQGGRQMQQQPQSMRQQPMQQQMQVHQQAMGARLEDVETPEQRAASEGIARAIQVCGWCADQCIQLAEEDMIECVRLCEDVTELGETALALLPRDSRQAGTVLEAFTQAARACAQECGQHHHDHCQECAEVLPRVADSVEQLVDIQSGRTR